MSFSTVLPLLLICYLIGSLPTAYLIGRLNGINIFEVGSGNMGATNVLRALGPAWGALVWLIDSGKGIAAILLARLIMPLDMVTANVMGALAVVVGHDWSVVALCITGKLRGGKGAATSGGTWLLMVPPLVLGSTLVLWGALLIGTRYMSLAVLAAFGLGALLMSGLAASSRIDPRYALYAVFLTGMVYVRHSSNIRALLAGRERRFGERVS